LCPFLLDHYNLLAEAAEKELSQLDEKLFFEVFSPHRKAAKKQINRERKQL